MRKIIPYLLLNFFISALAVLLVLFVWDWTHKTPQVSPSVIIKAADPTMQTSEPVQTLSLDQKTIDVVSVVGAGDVDYERIRLLCTAELPIDLRGWKLVDSEKNEFIFPLMTIFPGGGINVYSKAGVNTSGELYWGSADAIWTSGETAALLDSEGNLRATYLIP